MVNPIKKNLLKKAIAKKYYLENDCLVYEIELINFWVSPTSMHALFLHNDMESDVTIDCKGTTLFLKVPIQYLRAVNEVAYLELTINNKSVWITKSTRWDNFCE